MKDVKPLLYNYRGRALDPNKEVWAYRNLNKKDGPWYSVMQGGRVIGHSRSLNLSQVRFIVRESGRKRFAKTGRKNVHAFVVGRVCAPILKPGLVKGFYNPSTSQGSFYAETEPGTFWPVNRATAVVLDSTGLRALNPK